MTGTEFEIVHGQQQAIITEQGATLRAYTVDGRDIVTSFPEDASPEGCQGQHLLPWPNRIRDGRYDWLGRSHQLPINEVERNNAIHGLLNWVPWQVAELYVSVVRLRTELYPQPGWPGTLVCELTQWLDDDGFSCELAVRNVGTEPAPFGYAAHPYITLGTTIDDIRMTIPFDRYLETDERLLPIQLRLVEDALDGRPLGTREFDTAFCGAERDALGRWQVRLEHGDRACVVWGDESMDWLQIYTPADRRSIAVEPMTCGPDAFNEGPTRAGLITLAPGASTRSVWGIRAS